VEDTTWKVLNFMCQAKIPILRKKKRTLLDLHANMLLASLHVGLTSICWVGNGGGRSRGLFILWRNATRCFEQCLLLIPAHALWSVTGWTTWSRPCAFAAGSSRAFAAWLPSNNKSRDRLVTNSLIFVEAGALINGCFSQTAVSLNGKLLRHCFHPSLV